MFCMLLGCVWSSYISKCFYFSSVLLLGIGTQDLSVLDNKQFPIPIVTNLFEDQWLPLPSGAESIQKNEYTDSNQNSHSELHGANHEMISFCCVWSTFRKKKCQTWKYINIIRLYDWTFYMLKEMFQCGKQGYWGPFLVSDRDAATI